MVKETRMLVSQVENSGCPSCPAQQGIDPPYTAGMERKTVFRVRCAISDALETEDLTTIEAVVASEADQDMPSCYTLKLAKHFSNYQKFLETECGWVFEGPFYADVPIPSSEYITDEPLIRGLERFEKHLLETVFIDDGFDKDHSARMKFMDTIIPKKAKVWVKDKNKIKGGNLIGMIMTIESVIEYLSMAYGESSILKRVREIFAEANLRNGMEKYNAMELEEKKTFARKVDETIYKILEEFSEVRQGQA